MKKRSFYIIPCGTTLATAFGSDLRSVDTLRGSRFALRQPDDFVAGESRRLLPALVGGYADAIGGKRPFKDNYALLKKLSEM